MPVPIAPCPFVWFGMWDINTVKTVKQAAGAQKKQGEVRMER